MTVFTHEDTIPGSHVLTLQLVTSSGTAVRSVPYTIPEGSTIIHRPNRYIFIHSNSIVNQLYINLYIIYKILAVDMIYS